MAEYKGIKGNKIQNYTTDPDNPLTGQVWYNETDQVLKTFYVDPGSWSTGGDMNTSKQEFAGAGIQTSALSIGAESSPRTITESYNGSTWTEVNDLNTGRQELAAAGADNTSALAFGGDILSPPPLSPVETFDGTESWNGTSWTAVNSLNTARELLAGCGLQNAALAFGGIDPTIPTTYNLTESWNGTNWTEVNDLNTARRELSGAGTNTSALAFGGTPNGFAESALTESWNGTSWTEVNDLNTARNLLAGAGANNTNALAFGGETPPLTAATESWNGTNWTEVNDLNTTRQASSGAGASNTSALTFGGRSSPLSLTAATEEWTAGPQTKTITSS